ncbi:MAG: hypothetical protein FIB05_15525, partial [Betaproteobacteria bacterium]|nr:hypothetical protein [Betaproteobacteria bacterium]
MRLYQGSRGASGAAAIAIHALLALAALNARPIASAIAESVPLTVSIVSAPARPEPAPRAPPELPRLIEPARDALPVPALA